MSKSDSDVAGDLAEGAIGCVFALAWALIAGLIVFLFKAFQTKPEAKLRRLGPAAHWGTQTVDVVCTYCASPNESGARQCHACGEPLANSPASWSTAAIGPSNTDEVIKVAVVVVVAIVLLIILIQTQ